MRREGDFWLCEILGHAKQATARQAHATDLFEEGWWIVEIVWYKHEPGTWPRKYTPASVVEALAFRPQSCELRTSSLRVASATRVAVCVCCQMTRPSWCVRACKLYLGLCIAIGTPIFKGKMVFGTSGPVSIKGRYAAAPQGRRGQV